jgi:acetylornithine deacetylase/succinyl-diaminopimelate desuccinylase-like protein
MRLVPDQDPLEIAKLFEDYLRSMLPPTVTLEVKTLGAAKPARVDFKAPAIQAAARAYEKGVGFSPIFMGGGGTLPILSQFIDLLKVPVALIGFGLPDDNNHSPNEKFNIPCFQKGILTVIHYLDELASLPVKK